MMSRSAVYSSTGSTGLNSYAECSIPQWYVLRSSAGNAMPVAEQLSLKGIVAFAPWEYRAETIGKEMVWHQVPSQPDLLFLRATYTEVCHLIRQPELQGFHLVYNPEDSKAPMIASNDDMTNLIRIVEASIPQSYSVTEKEIHYRPGGMVLVTDGPFKGVKGHVARIHTQTRVVVTIPGVISYATTYIPKHQMTGVI